MADFDQPSADYLAQALAEMSARNASVAPLANESRNALPVDCPACGGNGRRGGCGGCGVTR